jgi:hypothetical protein
MPANITPEFKKAEEEYRKAASPQEKLNALKQMLATVPKHKGTEKMQADIKKRISVTKDQVQSAGKKKSFSIKVEKEGAGQICLTGLPNSGKSAIVANLTNAPVEVASYPFSTRLPQPAMMPFKDIQIQLVDLPPISDYHMEYWVPNILRITDMIMVVVDLADPDVLELFESTLKILEDSKIEIVDYKPDQDMWASVIKVRGIYVGAKADVDGASEQLDIIQDLYAINMHPFSPNDKQAINTLKKEIFDDLEIIRVYSKPPGKDPDMSRPFTLDKNSTLMDFASSVHRDFETHLKFARIWGEGKYDGQRVNHDYIIQDGDVIELHM